MAIEEPNDINQTNPIFEKNLHRNMKKKIIQIRINVVPEIKL